MRIRLRGSLVLLSLLVAAATGCDLPLAPLDLPIASSAAPTGSGGTPRPSPTATASPQPTPTATASATPAPTVEPTSEPTQAPTQAPTPTPVPTPTPNGTLIVGTSPEARGAWSSLTALARPRMGHVALVLDSRLVVAGGVPSEVLEGYRPAGDVWEEFDPKGAYAEAKRQTILAQYFSCGGTVGTSRVVVAGGYDGAFEIGIPRVYTWTEGFQFSTFFGASMPTPRYAVAGATIGNKLYVAGGLRSRTVSLDGAYRGIDTVPAFEAYDVTTNAWSSLPALPYAVSGAVAVAYNGQLCVLGGLLASGEPIGHAQVYRPDINQWITDPNLGALPPMRTARHSAAAAVLDGKIYVLGGMGEDRTALTACEVYDPATKTWQVLPPMPFARYLHGAAALAGKVYVLGGNNAAGQPQRTVEAFMP